MMLIAAYQALVLASRYHKKLADSTQIQQETMSILGRLERALSAASAESLEVSDDMTSIRFISARNDQDFFDLDPGGAPRWHRWVGIYLEDTTLIYKEALLPPPLSNQLPLSYPDLPTIKLDNAARRLELSQQVQRILFEDTASIVSILLETESKAEFTNGLKVLTRVRIHH